MDAYDIMLYATYLLAVVGTILSIVLPLLKSLDDPKGLMKSGLGVLGLAALFFICYSVSGNEVLEKFTVSPFNLTPGLSQFIGGMLIMTYILTVVAILSIVVTEVTKAVK
jgi:predicted acyltransferase